jgi:hypothetical protein
VFSQWPFFVGSTALLDAFEDGSIIHFLPAAASSSLQRDPRLSHFATQTVVNGKVYIATETTLEVYGLLP